MKKTSGLIKKLSPLVFTSLISLGINSSSPKPKDPIYSLFPSSSIQITSKLELNTDETKILTSYRSFKGGISDLQEIAKTSALEESYAFFPKENKWVEVGIGEKIIQHKDSDALISSCSLVNSRFVRLKEFYGPFLLFHTHPDPSLKKNVDPKQVTQTDKISREDYEGADSKVSLSDLVKVYEDLVEIRGKTWYFPAIPSFTDFTSLLNVYRNTGIIGNSKWGVVSPGYVSFYDIRPETNTKDIYDNMKINELKKMMKIEFKKLEYMGIIFL
ncbi:hypothetical protein K0A97_00280 [Patescibacteria group bacterium]|nr:hypothetical protein [Patescibacteria group bacterium]